VDAALIEIKDLAFRYPSGIEALKEVSLTIRRGERVALLGHNGSGKSTLAKHLNGLLKPLQGVVKINDVSTTERRVAQLAGMAALLFQNPDDQICKRTVWDEAAFGPRNLGYPEERVEALSREFLSAFGLLSRKELNPHDLGYSERKRLAMASVLAMDTPIVIFDEPTAGLDPREITLFTSVLRQLETEEKTVLIISHDMDFIAENIPRAVCLEDGRKRFDGHIADLFEDLPLLQKCGLIPPQIAQLNAHFQLRPSAFTPECFIEELTTRGT